MPDCDISEGPPQAAPAPYISLSVLTACLLDAVKQRLAPHYILQECKEEVDIPETAHGLICDRHPPSADELLSLFTPGDEGPPLLSKLLEVTGFLIEAPKHMEDYGAVISGTHPAIDSLSLIASGDDGPQLQWRSEVITLSTFLLGAPDHAEDFWAIWKKKDPLYTVLAASAVKKSLPSSDPDPQVISARMCADFERISAQVTYLHVYFRWW